MLGCTEFVADDLSLHGCELKLKSFLCYRYVSTGMITTVQDFCVCCSHICNMLLSLGWLLVKHICVNIGVFIDCVEQQLHVSAFIGHRQVVLREVNEFH